jgi:hypothetical protein
MLTFTLTFNKAFQSFTLTYKLLVIMAMLFDWDCSISNLVMEHSKVGTCGRVASLDDSPCVSLDIGLGLCVEFGEDWEEGLEVPLIIYWCLFNTFLNACPLVVLSCARTWSNCRAFLSMPYSFDVLVFNSFKHSCSLSFKISRWNLKIGNCFL